jgi:hypothetical protein
MIGLVSVYDVYMTVLYPYDVSTQEQNPVAMKLIKNFGVYGFVSIKSTSTIIAVAICLHLINTKYKVAIIPVFLFQLILFFYLTFYLSNNEKIDAGDTTSPLYDIIEYIKGERIYHEQDLETFHEV